MCHVTQINEPCHGHTYTWARGRSEGAEQSFQTWHMTSKSGDNTMSHTHTHTCHTHTHTHTLSHTHSHTHTHTHTLTQVTYTLTHERGIRIKKRSGLFKQDQEIGRQHHVLFYQNSMIDIVCALKHLEKPKWVSKEGNKHQICRQLPMHSSINSHVSEPCWRNLWKLKSERNL